MKRLRRDFDAKNAERCALIEKKFLGVGLEPSEAERLEFLTAWVDAEMQRVHPIDLSPLKEVVKRANKLQALVKKALELATRSETNAKQRAFSFAPQGPIGGEA